MLLLITFSIMHFQPRHPVSPFSPSSPSSFPPSLPPLLPLSLSSSPKLTCWATYAFAIVFWVYPPGSRPTSLVVVTTIVSFAAPAFAFLHLLLSPLGKDYDIVREGESNRVRMYQRNPSFFAAHDRVRDASWAGPALPGCCADRRVACLSCLCPFCMFGYNMERLGFGHRATHAAMCAIVLVGPVLVFALCAFIIQFYTSKLIVYYMGFAVAVIGLAYGGAWRVKMRETYKLPGSRWVCGSTRLTDVCLWVWCPWCALCQEVRTTEQYQVSVAGSDSGFYSKAGRGSGGGAGGEKVQPDAIEEAEEEGEDGESVMESEGEGEWENEDGREEFDEVDLEGGREGASGPEGKRRGSGGMNELNLNAPPAAVMQK